MRFPLSICAIGLSILSSASHACIFIPRDRVSAYLETSHKAFLGRVIDVTTLEDGQNISVEVTKTFKGQTYDIEDVLTSHTDCALEAEAGEDILFFVNQRNFTDQLMGSVDLKPHIDAETGTMVNRGQQYMQQLGSGAPEVPFDTTIN